MAGAEQSNVVVVGSASGIGAATARLLGEQGARVACLDMTADGAGATAEKINAGGGTARGLAADVRDGASVERAFSDAISAWGQVHALVNCVGVTGQVATKSHEVDLDAFDETYAVNLRGALLVSQVALRHMLERGYGRIAHVASIAGKEGNPNMLAYSTTKAGMIGMVKAMGKEYAESGIDRKSVV